MNAGSFASRVGRPLMGAGVTGLSAIGFATGEFVRRWEPVPQTLGLYKQLALVSNMTLFVLGVGLLITRTARYAGLGLAFLCILWIALLQPTVIGQAPSAIAAWGYAAGDFALASGAWLVWARLDGETATTPLRAVPEIVGRRAFGLPLLVFGSAHLAYAHEMAPLVPFNLPFAQSIVLATGVCYICAGVSLLSGLLAPVSAPLVALMMTIFVALVDVPHALQSFEHPRSLTGLCFETAMIGAAWLVASAWSRCHRDTTPNPGILL